MNEWPENLTGLDLNWNLFENASNVLHSILIISLALTGIGLAQAAELPAMLITEGTVLLDFSGWFADGAIGGYDGAGIGVGGW